MRRPTVANFLGGLGILLAALPAAAAPPILVNPRGVTVDIDEPTEPPGKPRIAAGTENSYVADTGNHRIVKVDVNGDQVLAWGTFGTGNGQFNAPEAVAVIHTGVMTGIVYVADTGNNRVQRFTSTGSFLGAWGSLGSGNGQFNSPQGIAADSLGNVFVADRNNHRIQKFNATGTFLTAWGSFGSGNGQFNSPQGVTVQTTGPTPRVYVADTGNHRVQRFSNGGTFQLAFGSVGSLAGQFNGPEGISAFRADNVYVADTNNHRIQGFNSDGIFLTAYGSMGSGPGQYQNPGSVAVTTAGVAQIADTGNSRTQTLIVGIPAIPAWGAAVLTAGFALGGWWLFYRRRRQAGVHGS